MDNTPEEHTDPLGARLKDWKVSFEKDPHLASHVLNRIAAEKVSPEKSSFKAILRWTTGLAAVAALVSAAFFTSQNLERRRSLNEGSYLGMINPVTRIHAEAEAGRSARDESLIRRLAWMQERMDLTQEQFLQLVELHQGYAEQFDQLYKELVRLDRRYDAFEEQRLQNEMIDFIALYEVLTERRMTEAASFALSRELIARVSAMLGPEQRATYMGLVQSTIKGPDA